jgi:hypothetical protein
LFPGSVAITISEEFAMLRRFALAAFVTLSLPRIAVADDWGAFILRLGQDTTSVERYHRTATRLEIEQVGRAGRVLQSRVVYDLADSAVTRATLVVTEPGTAAPVQTIDATFDHDSVYARIQNGSGPPERVVASVPHDAIVYWYACAWASYETAIARLMQGRSDSLRVPLYLLGSKGTAWLSLHRLGRDSVDFLNRHQEHYCVRVDATGRVLGALPISGPNKFTVSRASDLDIASYATAYVDRERAGRGLGQLSPRDTLRTTVAGASFWIDYSRPSKRGRAIFGGVVPYGEVWRTGANYATQFRTDLRLDFGGTIVPAGLYTLWTLPTATGWKLIINSETGQWGTAHDASKDLFVIDMEVSALPQVVERFTIDIDPTLQGGVLNLDWDTTRASVAFTVRPVAPVVSH